MYNIYQSLRESAENYPDQIAVIDEFGEISYQKLFEETELLIEELQSEGITAGMGVGIICSNSRHFIICLYASVACGALVMPIAPHQKLDEVKKSIEEAQLHVVIGNIKKHIEPVGSQFKSIGKSEQYYFNASTKDLKTKVAEFIKNPAFMRFTSGTTGEAKGVVLSHESVLERINAANEALEIDHQDRVLWVFPMAYHFIVSIVLYIKNAATIVVNNDFLAERIVESIQKYNATILYCSPMHINLLNAYEKNVSIATLRKVISTTTGISVNACKAFKEKYGINIEQAFGIIEVGLPIVNSKTSDLHPDAVGHALPAFDVKIFDKDGNDLGYDQTGLLAIKGPGMFDGYLSTSQGRNEVLRNGYFYTGDLAIKDDKGLVTIKGREKNVIIVHGNKVFPSEVEAVINDYKGVELSKVFGQKHMLFGAIVVAEIRVEGNVSNDDLMSYCRKRLSSYKVPQKIIQVAEIEMTSSGKVKRT